MDVVVDTNVLMDAILDQPNSEDCWQVLLHIRRGDITPVVCDGLNIEYYFIPSKIALSRLMHKYQTKEISQSDFMIANDEIYSCINSLVNILSDNSRKIEIKSNLKVCTQHPSDDKLVNLAFDGNCEFIITKNINHFSNLKSRIIKIQDGRMIKAITPFNFVSGLKLSGRHRVRYWGG